MCKMFACSVGPLSLEEKPKFHDFMSDLFMATDHDGHDQDACGFYAWSGDRRAMQVKKGEPGEIVTDTAWRLLRDNPCKLYICHARGAMTPVEPVINNHPFVGRNVALMHEGWLSEHRRLARAHGLELASETDSEFFMRYADRRTEGQEWSPVSCMEQMVKMTREPTAIAFIDHSSVNPAIYFSRNSHGGNHLFFVYRIPKWNAIFLVSTEEMWNIACELNELDKSDYVELDGITTPFATYRLAWNSVTLTRWEPQLR